MLVNSTIIFMVKENPKGTHNYGKLRRISLINWIWTFQYFFQRIIKHLVSWEKKQLLVILYAKNKS
jgi:hypothetical protein